MVPFVLVFNLKLYQNAFGGRALAWPGMRGRVLTANCTILYTPPVTVLFCCLRVASCCKFAGTLLMMMVMLVKFFCCFLLINDSQSPIRLNIRTWGCRRQSVGSTSYTATFVRRRHQFCISCRPAVTSPGRRVAVDASVLLSRLLSAIMYCNVTTSATERVQNWFCLVRISVKPE